MEIIKQYCFSTLVEFAKIRDLIKNDLIITLGEDTQKLFIAINEAVNNAIFHGNQEDEDKKVYLSMVKFPNQINVVIRDEGKGHLYNATSREENLFGEHGRGLEIIKHYTDCYKLNGAGNEITLVKKINMLNVM